MAERITEGGVAGSAYLSASLLALDRAMGEERPRGDLELLAGVAKVEIAPPIEWDVPLAGNRSVRFTRARGRHPESVWARAVALRQDERALILVTADIMVIHGKLTGAILSRIRESVVIESDQLMLVAAHTHSGPGGYWEGTLAEMSVGPYQQRIFDFLVDRIARVAVEAWNSVTPVDVSIGRADVELPIKNRSWVGGPENPVLGILRLKAVDGDAQIDLVNYSAHPTNLLKGNSLMTGDYPALMAHLVDDENRTLVFTPGTLGDQKPSFRKIRDGALKARSIAEYLVEEGLEKTRLRQLESPVLESFEFEVEMPPLRPRLTRSDLFGSWAARQWLAGPLFPDDLDRATVQVVRLGTTALIGAPSDLATSVAIPLFAQASRLGLNIFFVSMADDWIGYVMTRDEYLNVSYKETTQFHGPESGPLFAAVYSRLIDRLAQRAAGDHGAGGDMLP